MKHLKPKRLVLIATVSVSCFLLVMAGIWTVNFIRSINPNFMMPNTRLEANLNREFSQDIGEQIAIYGFVDFDQLTDFEWNYLLIVTPYQDPWQILEDNGIRRQRINSGIKYEDWQNLLIFMNDDKVAAYIDLPRSVADFHSYERNNHLIHRDDTTFYVIQPESVWQAWHGHHLAHWDKDDYFPLRNRQLDEVVNTIRGENERQFVFVEPVTDPDAISRHELSREIFPFAPNSSILDVPPYEEGTLPEYIVTEIVTLSLYQAPNPPELPKETIGYQNYSSGELLGFYEGTIQYVRSSSEYIGEGWWAVASWWQGTLYPML